MIDFSEFCYDGAQSSAKTTGTSSKYFSKSVNKDVEKKTKKDTKDDAITFYPICSYKTTIHKESFS